MNQQKRSLPINTEAKKSTTLKHEIKAIWSSTTTNHSQYSIKKQKLDSEATRRVKLPLRSNDNTLVRSHGDGSLGTAGIIINGDKAAVHPLSDGIIVETSRVKDQRTARKLKVDPIEQQYDNSVIENVGEDTAVEKERNNKDDGKRSLRSHDGGSRSKSELAQYFPNFDEIINPEAKEKGMSTPEIGEAKGSRISQNF